MQSYINTNEPSSDEHGYLSSGCLALDLEVGKNDGIIHAFGAVRTDTGGRLVHSGSGLGAALERLDDFADGVSFILGHNLIAFDLPHLRAAKPDLRLLELPAVDTLRLSPLAFPRNPYHHLVKHYQDGALRRRQLNDPELDARLALEVFGDQRRALQEAEPDLLTAWHWLVTPMPDGEDRAVDAFFSELRGARRPSDAEAQAAIRARLEAAGCATHARETTPTAGSGWALAYALAWLSVAGGNSVMPPWVRHQFPAAGRLVRRLRDTPCADGACGWCRERHDARKELKRWFGFEDFRPEPLDVEGRPMQRTIVEAAMSGQHVLGILPTGTGKSLCYQIPALSRYHKTGALTVVISPLVALMADQVAGLEAHGIGCCVSVNGLLTMPERADALDRVRLGMQGSCSYPPSSSGRPRCAAPWASARSAPGYWTRPTACRVGATTSGPTTSTWAASSGSGPMAATRRRCCVSPPPPNRTWWTTSPATSATGSGSNWRSSTAAWREPI